MKIEVVEATRQIKLLDDEGTLLATGTPTTEPFTYAWTQGEFVPVIDCSVSDMVLRLQEEYR